MFFCPFCGTLLILQEEETLLVCSSCSYLHKVNCDKPLTVTYYFSDSNKKLDDVDGASVAGAGEGQVITTPCQNEKLGCDGTKAQYIQIQMRSADEPPTTFFKCVKCGFQWKQD